MSPETISLIIGILTFIGGLATFLNARRLIKSQARTMDADAFEKFQNTLTKLQERNDSLYQENVALQNRVTDLDRSREVLRIRIEERETQLLANSKQLDLLRELAKTAPITETLKTQLLATNRVIENMQHAQDEMQKMIRDKERAFQDLFDSTRIPPLPKAGRTAES